MINSGWRGNHANLDRDWLKACLQNIANSGIEPHW